MASLDPKASDNKSLVGAPVGAELDNLRRANSIERMRCRMEDASLAAKPPCFCSIWQLFSCAGAMYYIFRGGIGFSNKRAREYFVFVLLNLTYALTYQVQVGLLEGLAEVGNNAKETVQKDNPLDVSWMRVLFCTHDEEGNEYTEEEFASVNGALKNLLWSAFYGYVLAVFHLGYLFYMMVNSPGGGIAFMNTITGGGNAAEQGDETATLAYFMIYSATDALLAMAVFSIAHAKGKQIKDIWVNELGGKLSIKASPNGKTSAKNQV